MGDSGKKAGVVWRRAGAKSAYRRAELGQDSGPISVACLDAPNFAYMQDTLGSTRDVTLRAKIFVTFFPSRSLQKIYVAAGALERTRAMDSA